MSKLNPSAYLNHVSSLRPPVPSHDKLGNSEPARKFEKWLRKRSERGGTRTALQTMGWPSNESVKYQDDRTPEQKRTHTVLVGGRDKFMSGWGKARGGSSWAYWAHKPEHTAKVSAWVNGRKDMRNVGVHHGKVRKSGDGHVHVYVVDDKHPALRESAVQQAVDRISAVLESRGIDEIGSYGSLKQRTGLSDKAYAKRLAKSKRSFAAGQSQKDFLAGKRIKKASRSTGESSNGARILGIQLAKRKGMVATGDDVDKLGTLKSVIPDNIRKMLGLDEAKRVSISEAMGHVALPKHITDKFKNFHTEKAHLSPEETHEAAEHLAKHHSPSSLMSFADVARQNAEHHQRNGDTVREHNWRTMHNIYQFARGHQQDQDHDRQKKLARVMREDFSFVRPRTTAETNVFFSSGQTQKKFIDWARHRCTGMLVHAHPLGQGGEDYGVHVKMNGENAPDNMLRFEREMRKAGWMREATRIEEIDHVKHLKSLRDKMARGEYSPHTAPFSGSSRGRMLPWANLQGRIERVAGKLSKRAHAVSRSHEGVNELDYQAHYRALRSSGKLGNERTSIKAGRVLGRARRKAVAQTHGYASYLAGHASPRIKSESVVSELDYKKHYDAIHRKAAAGGYPTKGPGFNKASRVARKLGHKVTMKYGLDTANKIANKAIKGESAVSEIDADNRYRRYVKKKREGGYGMFLSNKAERVGRRLAFRTTAAGQLRQRRRANAVREANNGSKILGVQLAKKKGGHLYTISPEVADLVGRMDMVIPKGMNEEGPQIPFDLGERFLSGSQLRRVDRARKRRRRHRYLVKSSTRRKLKRAARRMKSFRRRLARKASVKRKRLRSARRYRRLRHKGSHHAKHKAFHPRRAKKHH